MKRTVHGRGMVEVGIEAPFYARSRRGSVLDQALLPVGGTSASSRRCAHEDRYRCSSGSDSKVITAAVAINGFAGSF